MFYKYKLDATRVYFFRELAGVIFLCVVFVINSLYEVTVADVYSWRLSIVIGTLLMGLGFLIIPCSASAGWCHHRAAANLFPVGEAVGLSSLFLSPALFFIRRANGIRPAEVESPGPVLKSIL